MVTGFNYLYCTVFPIVHCNVYVSFNLYVLINIIFRHKIFTISCEFVKTLSTVTPDHLPHRTKSSRSQRLMFKQAALSSLNNAVEFLSLVLESNHDSKIMKVLMTSSGESRMRSLIAELPMSKKAPSWNCSDLVKLSWANFIRNALSSSSGNIQTSTYWGKSIGWSVTHNERVTHYLTSGGNNTGVREGVVCREGESK